MATPEASAYLASVKWGDEGHYLKEFTQKFKLPQVAKIIKGQYHGLGVPTLPSPTLNQVVFLCSAGLKVKIVAQCVKFKDAGRRMVPVGAKLAVPENYDGWFEILSEDGRSVRCMESVAELARRNPRSCLVRDTIKVHLPRPEDTEAVWDKTRTLSAGEILSVGDIVGSNIMRNGNRNRKFVKCVTSLGDAVYLPLEMRARFSCIAGEDNISGVHSVKTLMSKRFPLMVRLVHGKSPVGVKNGSQFVPEMRLFSLVEEESLVAMPLLKDCGVIPLPTNAPLKVLAPKNVDVLIRLQEHDMLTDRCRNLIAEASDSIQVCDMTSIREIKHVPPSPQYVYTRRQAPTAYRTIPLVKRSASDPQGTNGTFRVHLERGMSIPNDSSFIKNEEHSEYSDSDDYRYEEIDQIYDYVRGFAPLPPNIKNEFSSIEAAKHSSLPQIIQNHDNGNINKADKKPPEPPPIETIPPRKLSNGTVRPVQTPHKITVSIVNRTPCSRTKDTSTPSHKLELRKLSDDHIYEKIDRKRNGFKTTKTFENTRSPQRSNSASKVYTQNDYQNNNNNINNKVHQKIHNQRHAHQQLSSHHPHQSTKYRFLKHNRNSSVQQKEAPNMNKNNVKVHRTAKINSVKNISTSPLFHIRYKSLTDLLMDNKKTTPDSSNTSSAKKTDGSGDSFSSSTFEFELDDDLIDNNEDGPKSVRDKRRLSRPKSLSNLIGDMSPRRKVDNHNYYNLVQNDLIRAPDLSSNKFYSMPDPMRYGKNYYGNTTHNKKLGTLYL